MKHPYPILFVCLLLVFSACSKKYVTPGKPVAISSLADPEIAELLNNQPTASFPVNMAIARIQSPTYHPARPYMSAHVEQAFTMVLTRNVQEEESFEGLNKLEGVSQAAPFNRMLLPIQYESIKDLRMAAAKMRADILLVYTFDTQFIVNTKSYGPQNVITLGSLKNKEVKVATTASAALYDVQTEYLYGLAEHTSRASRKSNIWRQREELDQLRETTEIKALTELVNEIAHLWDEITLEYSQHTNSQ